jgi:hypothetical protein
MARRILLVLLSGLMLVYGGDSAWWHGYDYACESCRVSVEEALFGMNTQVAKVIANANIVPSERNPEMQQQNYQHLFRAVWSVTSAICSKKDFHASASDMRRACRYLMRSTEVRDKIAYSMLLATLQDENHVNMLSTDTATTSKGGEIGRAHHLQTFEEVKQHNPKLAEMLKNPFAHVRNLTEEVCVRTAGVCPPTSIEDKMSTCGACLLVLNDFSERMSRYESVNETVATVSMETICKGVTSRFAMSKTSMKVLQVGGRGMEGEGGGGGGGGKRRGGGIPPDNATIVFCHKTLKKHLNVQ